MERGSGTGPSINCQREREEREEDSGEEGTSPHSDRSRAGAVSSPVPTECAARVWITPRVPTRVWATVDENDVTCEVRIHVISEAIEEEPFIR